MSKWSGKKSKGKGRSKGAPNKKPPDPRKAVVEVLMQVIDKGQSLNAVLPLAIKSFDSRDQGLLQELVYGVLRWELRLEAILKYLMDRPIKEKDLDVQLLLMVGIYQLLYTRVPDHAAVSTSVNMVNTIGKQWAKGLVNGVLRRVLREKEAIEKTVDKKLHIRTSHPQWLCERVEQDWGDKAEQLLTANNERAPMSLRVNVIKNSRAEYLELLDAAEIKYQLPDWSSVAIVLENAIDTSRLPGFADGLVSVQDLAAQCAASMLNVKAGMTVLDACAAPGGKTAHIYESCPDLKHLLALDKSEARLKTLAANLERLDIEGDNIEYKTINIADDKRMSGDEFSRGSFDRILLDAPCSATGVIRRHPDIKMLRRASDITELAKQQAHLLENLWPLLAPGGMLLYSTCSILDQENEEQIASFLGQHKDAELKVATESTHSFPHEDVRVAQGWQVMPGQHDMDGFYYAMIMRKGDADIDEPDTTAS